MNEKVYLVRIEWGVRSVRGQVEEVLSDYVVQRHERTLVFVDYVVT